MKMYAKGGEVGMEKVWRGSHQVAINVFTVEMVDSVM